MSEPYTESAEDLRVRPYTSCAPVAIIGCLAAVGMFVLALLCLMYFLFHLWPTSNALNSLGLSVHSSGLILQAGVATLVNTCSVQQMDAKLSRRASGGN